jgi:PhnB protein
MLVRFDQSPEPVPEGMLQSGFEHKIMHSDFASVTARSWLRTAVPRRTRASRLSTLALTVPDEAAADRAFNALAEGGKVTMPLGKTFWSPRYGMVTDRFGVDWMVMVPGAST